MVISKKVGKLVVLGLNEERHLFVDLAKNRIRPNKSRLRLDFIWDMNHSSPPYRSVIKIETNLKSRLAFAVIYSFETIPI